MLIDSVKKAKNVSSWTVFVVAMIIYYFSVERTGSLWDVGEFILGAYKLEVVHPTSVVYFYFFDIETKAEREAPETL